jgi:hypothetical protein
MKTLLRAEDATEIRERLGRVTPEDVRRWGSMTVDEMMCHMRDAYDGAMGQRMVSPVTKRPPIPLPLYKWLAFRVPMRWPKGIETIPEIDPHLRGSRPVDFAADTALLLSKFSEFVTFTGPFPAHPIFGPMTLAEWKRWGYLHADHHLRQFGR